MSTPNNTTLRNVVEYLESIGLAVYGPCMNLDTGYALGANMDYNADQVVKYRALKVANPDIPFVEDGK